MKTIIGLRDVEKDELICDGDFFFDGFRVRAAPRIIFGDKYQGAAQAVRLLRPVVGYPVDIGPKKGAS